MTINNLLQPSKVVRDIPQGLYPKDFKLLRGSNNAGNNVKTDIIANSIAIPVKIPKYIVGIKLDKTKIENPNTIVIDVFSIATPTVE